MKTMERNAVVAVLKSKRDGHPKGTWWHRAFQWAIDVLEQHKCEPRRKAAKR